MTWVDGGNKGAQSGKVVGEYQYDFAPVAPPWTGGVVAPTGGKVGKVNYDFILTSGNWQLGKTTLKEPMLVTGNAVLYVTGDFKAENDIIIESGASLKFYMGGNKFEVKEKSITLNGGDATQFQYYGLPSNKTVKFKKIKRLTSAASFTPPVRRLTSTATATSLDRSSANASTSSTMARCITTKPSPDAHPPRRLRLEQLDRVGSGM